MVWGVVERTRGLLDRLVPADADDRGLDCGLDLGLLEGEFLARGDGPSPERLRNLRGLLRSGGTMLNLNDEMQGAEGVRNDVVDLTCMYYR